MAFSLDIGQNKTVVVHEPSRGMFSNNLGGAVEFVLAHFLFAVLRVAGNALGEFGASFLIRFLERIEPGMVEIGTPLIDLLLRQKDLPAEIRTFLNNLKHPHHEVGAAVLSGVLGSAGGAVSTSILGSLLMPVTYAINKGIRPSRPTAAEATHMVWRGNLSPQQKHSWLSELGYPDDAIMGFEAILQPRPDIQSLLEAIRRGILSSGDVRNELIRRGFSVQNAAVFDKLVNQLLGDEQLATAMFRDVLTSNQVVDGLQKLGYTASDAQTLLKIFENIPPLQDIIHMAVREAWRDDVAQKWQYDAEFPGVVSDYVKKLGYNPDWAKRYWRAHWELPSVTYGIEMVHRGIISPDEFKDLLRIADFPSGWRDRMLKAVYSPFTRVDTRRMYKLGVLNLDQIVTAYKDIGYDDWHAQKLAEFTVKYESADSEDKTDQYKQLSLSQIEKAYLKGLLPLADYRARLIDLKYEPSEADLIVSLSDLKRTIETTPDFTKEYQDDMKEIIERSYAKSMIDLSTAKNYLSELGVNPQEVDLDLAMIDFVVAENSRERQLKVVHEAYTSRAIDNVKTVELLGKLELPAKQQESLLDEWTTEISLGARRLTEAQYRLALTKQLISLEEYKENLIGLGYSDYDLNLLVALATS